MLCSKIIQAPNTINQGDVSAVSIQSTKVTYQQSQLVQSTQRQGFVQLAVVHTESVDLPPKKKTITNARTSPIMVFFAVSTYNGSSHVATCNQRSASFFHVEKTRKTTKQDAHDHKDALGKVSEQTKIGMWQETSGPIQISVARGKHFIGRP